MATGPTPQSIKDAIETLNKHVDKLVQEAQRPGDPSGVQRLIDVDDMRNAITTLAREE